MISQTYTINGHDWRRVVCKNKYSTTKVPIYEEYMDLDKKRHYVVSKRRHQVIVELNPMTIEDVTDFCEDLETAPLMLTFFSEQQQENLTRECMPVQTQIDATFKANLVKSGGTLILEEC